MAKRPYDKKRIDRRVRSRRKTAQHATDNRQHPFEARTPSAAEYGRTVSRSRFNALKQHEKRTRRNLLLATAAAIIAVAVFAAFLILSVAQDSTEPPTDSPIPENLTAEDTAMTDEERLAAEQETKIAMREAYEMNWEDVLVIPDSNEIIIFDLSGAEETSAYTGIAKQAVEDVMAAIEQDASCGFVFLDANTGRGLAYNADEVLYVASAAKVALAYHAVLEDAADNTYTRDNIESAIRNSSNDAYETFGYRYVSEDYGLWLDEHDIDSSDFRNDLYPKMSARSLTGIWAEIYRYLQSGTETSDWFGDLLASAEVSFIYDGLADTGATVMNKAGWIAESGYESVTDAAIISVQGRTFLMAIVTDLPAENDSEQDVAILARALFDARDELGAAGM